MDIGSNPIQLIDLEKDAKTLNISPQGSVATGDITSPRGHTPMAVTEWKCWVRSLGAVETRGINRVPPEERNLPSNSDYVQVTIIWFSANMAANNLIIGLLGPLLFQLGFLSSALIATFACFVGSLGPAYMSIWGAQSGNRTMVSSRDEFLGEVGWTDKGGRLWLDILWGIGRRSSPLCSISSISSAMA